MKSLMIIEDGGITLGLCFNFREILESNYVVSLILSQKN